ncbi:MAG: hypothetical protein ABR588_04485 [Sphingomicrobium sp.]|nr:hypothetical protein [Sphingomonadales bacterium]
MRAGIITYAADDQANCSMAGRLEQSSDGFALVPNGDSACRVGLAIEGDSVRTTSVPATCAYYCGKGATLSGKTFKRDQKASPATDLAGDRLC